MMRLAITSTVTLRSLHLAISTTLMIQGTLFKLGAVESWTVAFNSNGGSACDTKFVATADGKLVKPAIRRAMATLSAVGSPMRLARSRMTSVCR